MTERQARYLRTTAWCLLAVGICLIVVGLCGGPNWPNMMIAAAACFCVGFLARDTEEE